MRTIRRLYFYLVTFISLEMVIWGLFTLLKTILDNPLGTASNDIASGLSLVLVGLPIFLLHGAVVQRDAARDPEERANRLRAVFFHGVRLATLVPVVQGGLSALTHLLASGLQLDLVNGMIGSGQPLADHLVGIGVNGLANLLAVRQLRQEERAQPAGGSLSEVGRLYRYAWMIYSLFLVVYGSGSILWFILYIPDSQQLYAGGATNLVNGLALALIGAPVWAQAWLAIQGRQGQPGEFRSLLRQVILHALVLGPAAAVAWTGIAALSGLVDLVLAQSQTLAAYLLSYRWALSALVPLGVLWAYFDRVLRQSWLLEADELRRAELVRLYRSVLAGIGNIAVFLGAWQVLTALVDLLAPAVVAGRGRQELSTGIACLAVGLPLWLRSWRALQTEASQEDDAGDHARRSLQRRTYFYLAIFISVVGLMANAGILFYNLLNAALGNPIPNLGTETAYSLVNLFLFGVWLAYHLAGLRKDGRQAQASLARRHASFAVRVISDGSDYFSRNLPAAIQAASPGLPVTVFQPDLQGSALQDEFQADAPGPARVDTAPRAVILPASLAILPGSELAAWLSTFKGVRLVVPLPDPGWIWAGMPSRPAADLARETALAIRQLSEGAPLRPSPPNNPWVIAGYIFGGLFALEVLLVLFSLVMSFVNR